MTLKLAFDIRKVSTGDRRSSSVRIFEPYGTFDVRAEVGQVTFRVGFGPICKRDQPLGHGPFLGTTFCEIFYNPRPKFWQTDKTDTALGSLSPFLTSSELIVKVCANSVSVR